MRFRSNLLAFIKEKRIVLMITIVWWILSVARGLQLISKYKDIASQSPYTYSISETGQGLALIIAVFISLMLIYWFVGFLYKAVTDNESSERHIFILSIPVLIILLAYFITDVTSVAQVLDYYSGDERNIWTSAVRQYPFIFVYSGELCLICFMIFPTLLAPSIVKIFFCTYVFGYLIYRVRKYYKSQYAYLIYMFLFFLKPIMEYGIRVHRMQWYGMLYLLIMAKLFFDYKEGLFRGEVIGNMQSPRWKTIAIVSIGISILTIWRREGIYFLIFGLIYVILAYGGSKDKRKDLLRLVCIFCISEFIICIPETAYEMTRTDSLSDGNVVYNAYLVHMLDMEQFDREKCAEELQIIDQYMSIEQIDRYNTDCDADAYTDSYWQWSTWKDGQYYVIRTENWSSESQEIIKEEVVKLVKKQPVVFLLSRIKAFVRAGNSRDTYNLFIPLVILITLMLIYLIRREWFGFLLALGVAGHTIITTILMPASYFKYFYEMYLFAWIFGAIELVRFLSTEHKEKA